jgi:hypothetical protein
MAPVEKKRDVILLGGVTGSGKTFFGNALLYHYPRVIIASPIEEDEQEYDGIQTESFDDLVEKIDEVIKNKKKTWRFKISDLSEIDSLYSFAYSLGYDVGGFMLAIEEAETTIPGSGANLSQEFRNLLLKGRHPQVSMMFIIQRFSLLNINVRSQWRRIISFAQTEPADIAWLETASGNPIFEQLPSFPDRRYIDMVRGQAPIIKTS